MPDKIIITDEQIAFIQQNYESVSNKELGAALGLKLHMIRKVCYKLRLYRMILDYWTDEQIHFLQKNYKKIGDKELAILFNLMWDKNKPWTWKHIEKKRLYLNLKRTTEQLLKIKSRNKARGCWMNTTTWEKRGVAPIGTIKTWTTSGGRYQMKMIKTQNGFTHYGHWLYEQTFGPMPTGYLIGFKDGNNMNVVPENLEAITRGEHARRAHKYSPEVREAIKVFHQLNNLIKQKKDANRNNNQRQANQGSERHHVRSTAKTQRSKLRSGKRNEESRGDRQCRQCDREQC
jgi:hypothetical protein